uniref:HAT family dimerization domain containing protein n=1 Tax=Saccharum spontaneum TaxID=62335 RepID=A0A678T535_SACSP|nr:HAT family dimerization domain containing protein [Saccharum spontaneum]
MAKHSSAQQPPGLHCSRRHGRKQCPRIPRSNLRPPWHSSPRTAAEKSSPHPPPARGATAVGAVRKESAPTHNSPDLNATAADNLRPTHRPARGSKAKRRRDLRHGAWRMRKRFGERNARAATPTLRCEMPKKSDVWQHFTRVMDEHGKFVNEAECNYCQKFRRLVLSPECPGGSLDRACGLQKEASKHLAQMIALRGYDPSLLEDDCFRSFVASINPKFKVPSRMDMEEICDGVFDERRKDLFDMIRHAPGRLSLAVGTVTAIEREVLYTACHFIDDEWNLHKVIMDAYVDGYLLDPHGPLLGVHQVTFPPDGIGSIDKVMDGLSQRDVLDNLFFMVWETKQGHRVNRLELKNQIEQNKSNANLPTRTELTSNTYMDSVIHSIAGLLTLDPSFIEEDITSHLEDLDLTRQKTQKFLSELGLDNLWAYDEDWYSSYCSLQVLRKEGRTPNTGSVFAELLCNIWGHMDRSIQRISAFNSPTSNLCLVELFKLRDVLQSELAQASGDNANAYKLSNGFLEHNEGKDVAHVLGEAMDSLDKSIKDSYLVWSIPLILDPRYKLTYIEFIFKRAFVNPAEAAYYISGITEQVKELYADYIEYGARTNSANSALVTVTATGSSADPLAEAWAEHCSLRDGRSCTTDIDSYLQAEMELDRYLQDFLVPPTESFDILKWWKENSWNYPTVAQMARDALAMPTCSKLSSNQLALVKSILRGYSKAAYGDKP